MTQFACFKPDGSYHRVITTDRKPDPNPKKGFDWYPLGEEREGDESGWVVENGTAHRVRKRRPVHVPHIVQKATVWGRLTDQEMGRVQTALDNLKANNPRLYRLFMDLPVIDHNAGHFDQLAAAFSSLFGAERATAVLEPEA